MSSNHNPKILGTKGAKRRSNVEQAFQIKSEVLSLLAEANASAPVERRVTPKAALEVTWRSLNKSRGFSFAARRDAVFQEVSEFIAAAQGDLTLAAESRHSDLFSVSHPLSTAKHVFAMTASALKSARTEWLLADPDVTEDIRPLVASALSAEDGSYELTYALAGLRASGKYDVLESLTAAVGGGGNSYWERSMRAKLQRRDRYGKFAYMGGGLRALVRAADGAVSWLTGRVVGMDSKSTTYDLEAPDGKIYRVPSGNAEGLQAVLDAPAGSNGFGEPINVMASDKANIIDISDLASVDSPAGWSAWGDSQDLADGRKFQAFKHDSGEYSVGVFTNPDGSRTLSIRDEKNEDKGAVLADVSSWADVANALRDNTSNKEKRQVKARLDSEGLTALPKEDLADMLDTAAPAEVSKIDTAGDIEAQVRDAIERGDDVAFAYPDSATGELKNRVITPKDVKVERDGVLSVGGVDGEGNYKKFKTDRMADSAPEKPIAELPGEGDVPAKPKAEPEIQATDVDEDGKPVMRPEDVKPEPEIQATDVDENGNPVMRPEDVAPEGEAPTPAKPKKPEALLSPEEGGFTKRHFAALFIEGLLSKEGFSEAWKKEWANRKALAEKWNMSEADIAQGAHDAGLDVPAEDVPNKVDSPEDHDAIVNTAQEAATEAGIEPKPEGRPVPEDGSTPSSGTRSPGGDWAWDEPLDGEGKWIPTTQQQDKWQEWAANLPSEEKPAAELPVETAPEAPTAEAPTGDEGIVPAPPVPMEDAVNATVKDDWSADVQTIPYDTKVFVPNDPNNPNGAGTTETSSGTTEILDIAGRKVIMVDVNGVKVPFYLSSGAGGKKDVPAGKWYPFFGVADGWFNKTGGGEITGYYGNPELKSVSEFLDKKYGDIRNDSSFPKASGVSGQHLDFINQDMNPTENETPNTRINLDANIADVKQRIADGRGDLVEAPAAPEADGISPDQQGPEGFFYDQLADQYVKDAVRPDGSVDVDAAAQRLVQKMMDDGVLSGLDDYVAEDPAAFDFFFRDNIYDPAGVDYVSQLFNENSVEFEDAVAREMLRQGLITSDAYVPQVAPEAKPVQQPEPASPAAGALLDDLTAIAEANTGGMGLNLGRIRDYLESGTLPTDTTPEDIAAMAERLADTADSGRVPSIAGKGDLLRRAAEAVRGREAGREAEADRLKESMAPETPTFDAPAGMYNLDIAGFEPSNGADNPEWIANRANESFIQYALEFALKNEGFAYIDLGDGEPAEVSAEALYLALEEQGLDAQSIANGIYGNAPEGEPEVSPEADIADVFSKPISKPELDKIIEDGVDVAKADEDADYTEKPSEGNLPPRLAGLTPDEIQSFIDGGYDHTPFLPKNEDVEMPEGFNTIDPSPFRMDEIVTVEEGDSNNVEEGFPVGWTNDPYWIANNFANDPDSVIDAFKASFSPDHPEPGYAMLINVDEDGEEFPAWVDVRAVRDALQLQGYDTNELMREVAEAGFAGQRGDNSDLTDGDIDAMINGEGIDIDADIEGDAPEEVLPARAQEAVAGWESSTINWGGEDIPAFVKTIDGVKYAAVKGGNTHFIVRIGRDGKPYDLSTVVNGRNLRFVNNFDSDNPAAFDAFMKHVAEQRATENRDGLIATLKNAGFDQSVIDMFNSDASIDDIRAAIEADPRFAELKAAHEDYQWNPRGSGVPEVNRRRAADSSLFMDIRSGSRDLQDIVPLSDEEKSLLIPNIGYPNNVISGTRMDEIIQDAFDGKDIPTTVEEISDTPKTIDIPKSEVKVPAAKSDAAKALEDAKADKKVEVSEVEAGSPEADKAFDDVILDTAGDQVDEPEFFAPDQPIGGQISLAGGTVVEGVDVTPAGTGTPLKVSARLLPRFDGEPERYEVVVTDPSNPDVSILTTEASTLGEAQNLHRLTVEGLLNGSTVINSDPNYGVNADDITEGDRSPEVSNPALKNSPFERLRILGSKAFQKWREENYIYADGRNQARKGDRVVHFYDGFNTRGEGRIVAWETIHNSGDRARKGYAYVQFQDGSYALWATDMMFLNGRRAGSANDPNAAPPSGAAAPRPFLDPKRVQQVALTNRYIVERRREGTVIQPYTSIDRATWKAETRRAYDMYLQRKARIDAYRQAYGIPTSPEPRLRPRGDRKHFPVWVRAILAREDGGDNAGGIEGLRSGQRGGDVRARARRIVEAAAANPNAIPAAPSAPARPAANSIDAGEARRDAQRLVDDLNMNMSPNLSNAGMTAYMNPNGLEMTVGDSLAGFRLTRVSDGWRLSSTQTGGTDSLMGVYPDVDAATVAVQTELQKLDSGFNLGGLRRDFADSTELNSMATAIRDMVVNDVDGVTATGRRSGETNSIDVYMSEENITLRLVQSGTDGKWGVYTTSTATGEIVSLLGSRTDSRIDAEYMMRNVVVDTHEAMGAPSAQGDVDVASVNSPDGFLAARWLDRELIEFVPSTEVDFTGIVSGVVENDPNRVDANPTLNANGQPVSQADFIAQGWTPRKAAEIARAGKNRPSTAHIMELYKAFQASRSAADEQALHDAIARGMGAGDVISGNTVKTRSVSIYPKNDGGFKAVFNFDVIGADGSSALQVNTAGHTTRTLTFDANGVILDAHNDYLRMADGVRGSSGFATNYNQHCENWYIANGAKQITVQAQGGSNWTGSFVWAITGFNWQGNGSASNMLTKVKREVDKTRPNSRARKDFDALVARAAKALGVDNNYQAVIQELDRTRGVPPKGFPTPRQYALVGWTPKEALKGTDKGNWAGQTGMKSDTWFGVKNLTADSQERIEQIAYDDMKFYREIAKSGKTNFTPNAWMKKLFPANMDEYSGDRAILAEYSDELSDLMHGAGARSVSLLSPKAKAALSKYVTDTLNNGSHLQAGNTAAIRKKNEENTAALIDVLGALHRDRRERYPSHIGLSTRGQQLQNVPTEAILSISTTETPLIINGMDTGFIGKQLTGEDAGSSPIWKFVDSSTGETFFVKRMDDFQGGTVGADSEVQANVIARAMGLLGVSNVQRMNNDPSMMITSEVGSTLNLDTLPASLLPEGQSPTLIRASMDSKFEDVKNMDLNNAMGILALDILIGNSDRHSNNIMMARNPEVAGATGGGNDWIPLPFDHGFAEVLNTVSAERAGIDPTIDWVISDENYTTTRDWGTDLMANLGPVAFKMMIDKRLEIVMDNLRGSYGAYLPQDVLDTIMGRAQQMRDMSAADWQAKLS